MKTRSDTFQFEKELDWKKPAPGIRRQMMGYDGQLMMVKVEFEEGAVGAVHQHYHSQATYVASGKFELTIGDRKEILSTGDDNASIQAGQSSEAWLDLSYVNNCYLSE